ncbi:MAG: TorF family putative porin [Casimicrobiaceae bacterium]
MSAILRALPAAAAFAVGVLATNVHAQTSAPALAEVKPPDPPYALTGNFGIYSQYIFRGLTQTDTKPAFQGGIDLTHESGFYLGTWGSNISWLSDAGACNHGCSLEWDFYGGWRHTWNEDWGLDVGALQYWYPGSYNPGFSNPNTTELYIAGSWKWLSLKFSDVVSSKTFGTPNSRGTWYLEANAAYPLTEQLTLVGHVGRQDYHGSNNDVDNSILNYSDWKLGATYLIKDGWSVGAYWTDTNANQSVYTLANRFIGKSTGTAFIQKTF